MPVVAEELEEKVPQGLLVCLPKPCQGRNVVIEGHLNPIYGGLLFSTSPLQTGQDGWISRLQKVNDETDPSVGAQRSSQCCE